MIEHNTATTNYMSDTNMGKAQGAHESPTASPREPTTLKRPPKRPRPQTSKKDTEPPVTPQKLPWPGQSSQATPPGSPPLGSPQSQLDLELQSHISAAVASRTAQIKTTGDEVMELVSIVSQKIAYWEERSLQGAASLGKDIRSLVLSFSKNLATGHPAEAEENCQPPPSKNNGYAEAAKKTPYAPKAHPKIPKTPYKASQHEKPPRIFLRLPKNHPARRASPHATMDILRKHLDKPCSEAVKEIQQVPSGLAIWPRDGLGLHLFTERKEALESFIQGAKAEVEQNWAIFALPNAPQEYTGYDGTQIPITEPMALEEFKLQTGLSPLKFYRSNKNPTSGTLIMAVPENQAHIVPKWVHLYGKNVQIKRKPFRTCIEQCTQCWDYHNPRTCTRTPRCRICSKRDHTEESHPPPNDDETSDPCCTNCCGPFPADHANCPTKPTIQQGVIQQLSRSQFIAVRKAGARQHMFQDQTAATRPSRNTGSSSTREQPLSC